MWCITIREQEAIIPSVYLHGGLEGLQIQFCQPLEEGLYGAHRICLILFSFKNMAKIHLIQTEDHCLRCHMTRTTVSNLQ